MNKNESKYFNTARKMNDALISLLEKKNFEYISIKDICKEADVNRSTFYLHYENTYDLLEETIQTVNASFNTKMNSGESMKSILARGNNDDLLLIKDEFMIPYLEFIKENIRIFRAIESHPELFHTDKTFSKMFKELFSPIMTRFGLDVKWHKFLIDYYIHGITSFIMDWVKDGCLIPVNEVAAFLKGLINSNAGK